MLVVAAGKGGVGKTAFIATLSRLLQGEECQDFVVIDADPAGMLGHFLEAPERPSVAERVPPEESQQTSVTSVLVSDVLAPLPGGGHLVTMGHHRTRGCFCRVNALTRLIIGELLQQFPLILMDNEAGLEHITRGTGRQITRLVMLADESQASLRVAEDLLGTIMALNNGQADKQLRGSVHLGVLSTNGDAEAIQRTVHEMGLPAPRLLPRDVRIAKTNADFVPFPLSNTDSPYYRAVKEWVEEDHLLSPHEENLDGL